MKSTTLLLIGGLVFAGNALAGDPTPQQTASPSVKVGIDQKTGKLRPLTVEESAALDAQAPKTNGNARSLRANVAASRSSKAFALPTTEEEAQATKRVINGTEIMKPMAESMSSITVTRNADGSLQFQENGEAIVPAKRENASE